ncbi:MAG: UpxY family transcription antiterminator [Bacteroidales bacterium]|nr:UpxY family transcription antiterminator [Bacteroidales bacterium]
MEPNDLTAKVIDTSNLQWYACYTKPRAEKVVHQRLVHSEIESYLPVQRTRRKWSDRIKWVDEPLFRSYIFVRVNVPDFIKVLQTEGIVRFITFERKAVPIPETQIEAIRMLLGQGVELEVTTERIKPGQAIEVQAGPLMGIRGELVEYRGNRKVLVRLGEIGQGILVTIGPESLLRI